MAAKFRLPGKGANHDRKIRMVRMANSAAGNRHGIGGLEKTKAHAPRPITLAKMPWDDATDDSTRESKHDRD